MFDLLSALRGDLDDHHDLVARDLPVSQHLVERLQSDVDALGVVEPVDPENDLA